MCSHCLPHFLSLSLSLHRSAAHILAPVQLIAPIDNTFLDSIILAFPHIYVRFLLLPLLLLLILLLLPFPFPFPFIFLLLLPLLLIRSCSVSIVSASFLAQCIFMSTACIRESWIVNCTMYNFGWLLLLFCSFLCRCMILIEFSLFVLLRLKAFEILSILTFCRRSLFFCFLAQGSFHLAPTFQFQFFINIGFVSI